MDNRNLFQFEFVNHYLEKERIELFLNTEKEHVLWLSGEHGIGKTFLLDQIEKFNSEYKKIDLRINGNESQSCLFMLLLLLQNNSATTIKQFIEKNYDHLSSIGKDIVLQVFKNKGLDIESLVNATFDSTKIFINNKKKEQSAQKVIINYILNMSKKEKILFVFDDFSLCDDKSTDYIIEIILQLLGENNIKFIISTTPEELEKRQNIQILLLEKLPLIPLQVESFKDDIYFYEILSNIFELKESDVALVSKLFIKYNGKPDFLKKFLRELYCKNGVIFLHHDRKAKWNREIVSSLIDNCITQNLFTFSEKLILRCIISFNQLLSYTMLYDIAMYLADKALHSKELLENEIKNSVKKLLDTGILQFAENGKLTVTQSDVTKTFEKEVWNSVTGSLFSSHIYSFLNNYKDDILENNITLEEWHRLIAQHAFISQTSGWEEINYSYVKMLYQKSLYEKASEILKKIPISNMNYQLDDYILIINCYFESGNYKEAEDIISVIEITSSSSIKQKVEYTMLCSKVFNITLKKEKAVEELDKLLPMLNHNTEQYLEVLNRKQEILVDMLNGKEKAKNIFDLFVDYYNDGRQDLIIGKALKNSIDFYHANNAFSLLENAEKIFIQNENSLELGFLYTNRGFEYFRQNNIQEAKKDFQFSIDYLKDIRFYEISYPLNNIASCYMYEDNYEKAISLITQARLYNKSNYVEIVLKTQLMMCYCMQKNYDDAENLAKELIAYVSEHNITDPTMLRKIYVNIGILYIQIGDEETAFKFVSDNYKYAKNTSTWYRAYNIMKLKDSNIQNPLCHCIETEIAYWSKKIFEPWLVTFSHD